MTREEVLAAHPYLIEASCGHLVHPEHRRVCRVHKTIECLACASKHEGRTGA